MRNNSHMRPMSRWPVASWRRRKPCAKGGLPSVALREGGGKLFDNQIVVKTGKGEPGRGQRLHFPGAETPAANSPPGNAGTTMGYLCFRPGEEPARVNSGCFRLFPGIFLRGGGGQEGACRNPRLRKNALTPILGKPWRRTIQLRRRSIKVNQGQSS